MNEQKDMMMDICMCIDSTRTAKEKAAWIFANYLKPLKDALTDSKERERVLVDALEAAADYIGDESCGSSEFWDKYRSALASVKEVQHAE